MRTASLFAPVLLIGVFSIARAQPAAPASAPSGQPTTTAVLPADGPLRAVVTAISGKLVRVRKTPDGEWIAPEIGMELEEGAALKTGPKSMIQIKVLPDHTITLDRNGTMQILRARFQNGTFEVETGLPYGRTQYEVEASGRQNDAKVRSPSSVLAIRGTKVILFDQPPFAPEAVSFTGRALFRDARKQVTVGSKGGRFTRVSADRDNTAQTALADSSQSGKADFTGRNGTEKAVGITLATLLQPGFQVGVFETIRDAKNQSTLNSLSGIGVVPNAQDLSIELGFTGSAFANVDLRVLTPLGELLTVPVGSSTQSGGIYLNDNNADAQGANGFDQVIFPDAFNPAPPGRYTITTTLNSGTFANTRLLILPSKNGTVEIGPFTQNLTTGKPSQQITVNVTRPPGK